MTFIRGELVQLTRDVKVDCDVLAEGLVAEVDAAADLTGMVTIKIYGRLERVPQDALREFGAAARVVNW